MLSVIVPLVAIGFVGGWACDRIAQRMGDASVASPGVHRLLRVLDGAFGIAALVGFALFCLLAVGADILDGGTTWTRK